MNFMLALVQEGDLRIELKSVDTESGKRLYLQLTYIDPQHGSLSLLADVVDNDIEKSQVRAIAQLLLLLYQRRNASAKSMQKSVLTNNLIELYPNTYKRETMDQQLDGLCRKLLNKSFDDATPEDIDYLVAVAMKRKRKGKTEEQGVQ